MKFDAAGNVEWQKTFRVLGTDFRLSDIKQTREGGYIATGQLYVPVSGRMAVVKLTSTGSVEWGRNFDVREGLAVTLTSDGNYLVLGTLYRNDGDTRRHIVTKLNPLGNVVWQRRYDAGEFLTNEILTGYADIKATADGGAVLAAPIAFRDGDSLWLEPWVAKLRSDGVIEWQRSFANADAAQHWGNAYYVTLCADGSYVVSCLTARDATGDDHWILHLDSSGAPLRARSYNFGGTDGRARRVTQTRDGGFITAHAGSPFIVLKIDRDLAVSPSCAENIGRVTGVVVHNANANLATSTLTHSEFIPQVEVTSLTVTDTTEAEQTICDNIVYPPRITQHPQSQFAMAGAAVNFGAQVEGTPPLNFHWHKKGVPIAGAGASTLTLNSVTAPDSSDYSLAVWNAHGLATSESASLAVLTEGSNGTPPNQAHVEAEPPTSQTQNNLVVITHGWQIVGVFGQYAVWIDDMANLVRSKLSSQGRTDWHIVPIHWEEVAWGIPEQALSWAIAAGYLYGRKYAQLRHWEHVHLIAHSAGARFIESFAMGVKAVSPDTEIHCTFLDPYLSLLWGLGKDTYGQSANWSDCYFARDPTFVLTSGPLDHAHNVNVTLLDPNLIRLPFVGVLSTHGWSHDFYTNTVDANLNGTGDYGFPLSKEGGGWARRGDYALGEPPVVLPVGAPSPPVRPDVPIAGANLALNTVPTATSSSGVTVSGDGSIALVAGQLGALASPEREKGNLMESPQPTWLAVGLPVSSAVNFVEFDSRFTSTNGAEGLLSVYLNTNQLGIVDERVVSPEFQKYRFPLQGLRTNGLYTLSFRLDAFNSTVSSLIITNLKTGWAGPSQPIVLNASISTNTGILIQLTAPLGYTYVIQSSTNLSDWAVAGLLFNTNGTAAFVDTGLTNRTGRFYRVLLPF